MGRKFQTQHNKTLALCFLLLATLLIHPINDCFGATNKKQLTVVLDPGHGGPDLGATGKFAREKDVVLKISNKLGKLINERLPDVKVVYTRDIDTLIALDDRGVVANSVGADLFISIHANGNEKSTPFGTETYVMGLNKTGNNMEVAMLENATIMFEEDYETKYEGYDPNSPESFILFSFMQNTFLEQSLAFASYVENEFAKRCQRKSRGVKQGPFIVLWKTTMPSVLVEVGFITNAEEEKFLASNAGQTEIAEGIFWALNEYKKRWEGNGELVPMETAANNAATGDRMQFRSAATTTSKPVQQAKPKPTATATSAKKGNITYHVQILSASKPIPTNSKEFRGLKNVKYYRSGNSYRYYVGEGRSFKEMSGLLRDVKKKFPDAFVVKLIDYQPYR